MTNDTMFEVSKFVGDDTKIVFTGPDRIDWFKVYAFSEDVLKANNNNARQMFFSVMSGQYKDEIKPFIKYVRSRGSVLQLFDEGNANSTPVMNILGLLAYTMRVPDNDVAKHVRDMAANSLVNFIVGDPKHIENARANAALSEPIQELLRKATAQQRSSAGAVIAPPPEQVLAVSACVSLVYLS
jgi:hypothetical protein